MKKRFLILAGVLALTVAVSGCGKKKDTDVQPVAASATPTPEVTKAAEIVDMKQPTEEEIANIMGEESATASKVIFVNNMGSDISSVYIRQHVEDEDDSDDDTWGSDPVSYTHLDVYKRQVISGEMISEDVILASRRPVRKAAQKINISFRYLPNLL